MTERTAEQVRDEIAAERLGLHQDLDGLKAAFRARVPFLIGIAAGVALLVAGLVIGIRKIRKL